MCVGQPQTFTKMPEGAEDMPARPTVAQYAAAVANREALLKPEIDPRINPMDANSLFQVSNESQHWKKIHSERPKFVIERKLKVRKSRKQFMVSLILPKNEQIGTFKLNPYLHKNQYYTNFPVPGKSGFLEDAVWPFE